MSCNIRENGIFANNDNPSILYKSLEKQFGSEEALNLYAVSLTDNFYTEDVDVNGEATPKALLQYIASENTNKQPLNLEQKQDLRNSLLGMDKFDVEAFYDENGLFFVNAKKLIASGMYSQYEASNLQNDLELQDRVKEAVEAIKNTENLDLEGQQYPNLEKSAEINSLGKLSNLNPNVVNGEILEALAGTNEEEFENAISELEFPNFQKELEKPIKKILIQKVISQLKKNKLANNIFVYSNAQIEQKLRELGVDVSKQVVESQTYYSNAQEALINLKDKNVKNVQGWISQLTDTQKNGGIKNVNQELEWIGLEEYLNNYIKENNPKAGNISFDVVNDFVQSNQIEIVEVSKESSKKPKIGDIIDTYRGDIRVLDIFSNGKYYVREIESQKEYSIREEDMQDYLTTDNTKYSGYQLKGAENYREVLLTMPTKTPTRIKELENLIQNREYESEEVQNALTELAAYNKISGERYTSNHWDESNVLAHVRLNEKTVPDGRRVLIANEIQSDWAQEGRKKGFDLGDITYTRDNTKVEEDERYFLLKNQNEVTIASKFKNDLIGLNKDEVHQRLLNSAFLNKEVFKEKQGIQQMPYKNTDQWTSLVTRRVLQMAAQEGYDGVSFATGQQSADMYSLSRQVDKIDVSFKGMENQERAVYVVMKDNSDVALFVEKDGNIKSADQQIYVGKRIDEVLGKEASEKIMSITKNTVLEGEGLEFGGEGMKTFYDKIVTKVAQKEAQRFDKNAKLEGVDFSEDYSIDKENTIYMINEMKSYLEENKKDSKSNVYNIVIRRGYWEIWGDGKPTKDAIGKVEIKLEAKKNTLEKVNKWLKEEPESEKYKERKEDLEEDIRDFSELLSELKNYSNYEEYQLTQQKIKDLEDYLSNLDADKLAIGKQPFIPITSTMKESLNQAIPLFQKEGIGLITAGFTFQGDVFINSESNSDTAHIHEFQHLHLDFLKANRPEVYRRGLSLIEAELNLNGKSDIQDTIDYVKRTQANLTGEKLTNEILTELLGRDGINLISELKDKKSGILNWLREVWAEIKNMWGISDMTDSEIMNLTLGEYARKMSVSLLKGEDIAKKYKNQLFQEMQGYKKAEVFKEEDGEIKPTLKTNTETTLLAVVRDSGNFKMMQNIQWLMAQDIEVLQNDEESTTAILKSIEDGLINEGFDVIGLSTKAVNDDMGKFLGALNTFLMVGDRATLKSFSEVYDEYFETDLSPKTSPIKTEQKDRKFVKLDTILSEEEVYNQQGLIKQSEGIYIKVNKKTEEELYAILETYPEKFPKGVDLRTYVQSQLVNTGEVIQLFKMYYDIKDSKDTIEKGNTNFTGDASYLQGEFISDFYIKGLKEKVKDSQIYKNFYSNFEVTERGLELKYSDDITLQTIRDYASEDLIQYSLLSKSMPELVEFSDETSTKNTRRDDVVNSKNIKQYEGNTSILDDNNIIVKNTTDEFIKVGEDVFENVETIGNLSLFSKLESGSNNYYSYNTAQPKTTVSLKNYTYLENTIGKGVDSKNYLSSSEKSKANKDFNCI